jgi:mono/diheme cytochrome c family protein
MPDVNGMGAGRSDSGRRLLIWMVCGQVRAQDVDAAALYGRQCAACHGDQRTGGMGPALLPESLARQRPAELAKVIADGRKGHADARLPQHLVGG